MTTQEIEQIMIEKGITVRAIPKKIISHWTIQEKNIPNCKNKIIYNEKGKPFEEKIKVPENGGKFIIVNNCGNDSLVNFKNCKYFNSIDEAIKSLI